MATDSKASSHWQCLTELPELKRHSCSSGQSACYLSMSAI